MEIKTADYNLPITISTPEEEPAIIIIPMPDKTRLKYKKKRFSVVIWDDADFGQSSNKLRVIVSARVD